VYDYTIQARESTPEGAIKSLFAPYLKLVYNAGTIIEDVKHCTEEPNENQQH
jgi:hypothetical protein